MDLATAKLSAAAAGINVKSKPYLISRPDANPKTAKNQKFGVLTSPLHLAPADLSGFNVCAQASAGCIEACLHTAGNPAHMAGKERARIAKTRFYFQNREAFLTLLVDDMRWLARKADRQGLRAGLRLNATSDIPWERVIYAEGRPVTDVAEDLGIALYDYTKITKRALATPYHLTFSRTEDNDADCLQVLQAGNNVAAVFLVNKANPLPATWNGYQVIDGDESDWRPGDKFGVVVGLKAKGRAKADSSGFVIRAQAPALQVAA